MRTIIRRGRPRPQANFRHPIRSRVVALAMAATLSVAGALTVLPPEAAAAAGVENEGADCAVTGLPDAGSLPTDARLPDPFRKLDNTRISTRSEWRCRREEIKRLAERFVYGEKPAKPASVTGTVSRTGITHRAVRRQRPPRGRDRRHGMLAVRQGRLRDRRLRPAHRPDHADRVG
ncbi:hypothetical protein Misp01_03000 [Microtetraspora sp. NBRC 13810]|nr:hypothetical protein Misp01_03000 [Microtetraspora sp. NBRC 13810]